MKLFTTDPLAIETPDGQLHHFPAVACVHTGTDIPPEVQPVPLPLTHPFWVDCSTRSADTNRLQTTIQQVGYVLVELLPSAGGGRVERRAVEYLPDTGDYDDLRLDDNTLASANYWRASWFTNPTRVARMVYGFGIK